MEGHYIRLYDPTKEAYTYYYITQREIADYVYTWPSSVPVNTESDPASIENLKPLSLNRLYQTIFGVSNGVLIYVDLPHGTRMRGTDKKPKASTDNREIGWIDHYKSPYRYPSFVTEFFLQKGGSYEYPILYAYNGTKRALTPKLYFIQNKLIIDEIRDPDTLEKLRKRQIPCRPITLGGLPSTRTGPS